MRHLTTNAHDANITRTVIALAHNLDLNVLAEGVETAEHVAYLKQLGCEEAQGFFFARPMPPGEFLDFALDCQAREPEPQRRLLGSMRRLQAE